MPNNSEEFRHECECRYWIRITGGKKRQVDELMIRIAAKRGKAAADRLRDGMRAMYPQWREGK